MCWNLFRVWCCAVVCWVAELLTPQSSCQVPRWRRHQSGIPFAIGVKDSISARVLQFWLWCTAIYTKFTSKQESIMTLSAKPDYAQLNPVLLVLFQLYKPYLLFHINMYVELLMYKMYIEVQFEALSKTAWVQQWAPRHLPELAHLPVNRWKLLNCSHQQRQKCIKSYPLWFIRLILWI